MNGLLYQVYKLGSITRAINVNRFSNYVELQRELVDMFNLECQLDQEHGWQLVFRDNEDDLLLVGDDPWEYVSLTPILLFSLHHPLRYMLERLYLTRFMMEVSKS